MLAYTKYGEGRPLIFLHGVGLSSQCWFNQVEYLSKNYAVYVVDLPGHGDSPLFTGAELSMGILCEEVAGFHKAVIAEPAILIGHSLGALICVEYAAAFPDLVKGIIPISTVYKRNETAMLAVKSRSEQLLEGGTLEFIAEAPVERWFGENPTGHIKAMAELCRGWLQDANLEGYAAAYKVFAQQDGASEETLANIQVPALFMTGDDDPNSTPKMSRDLSFAVSIGFCEVVDEARHMPQVSHPHVINKLIEQFADGCHAGIFKQRFDVRELRSAFGSFMTGVTIVTATTPDGNPVGFTANSFSSVSIDPPLLLVCPSKTLSSFEVFNECEHFAVNILSEHQQQLSNSFAGASEDRFKDAVWSNDKYGVPILANTAAHFSCKPYKRVEAGDHIVLIGEVLDYHHNEIDGLGYSKNGYFTLGLERKAQENYAKKLPMTTGVIIEREGSILLKQNGGKFSLPEITDNGINSSLEALYGFLKAQNLNIQFGPIYSTFESQAKDHVYTYYRAISTSGLAGDLGQFIPFDEVDKGQFESPAIAAMITRYVLESQNNGFGLYIGDEESGKIRSLN